MCQGEHDMGVWVDAIAKFHFQSHFEGHENDLCSTVKLLSISDETSTFVVKLVNKKQRFY